MEVRENDICGRCCEKKREVIRYSLDGKFFCSSCRSLEQSEIISLLFVKWNENPSQRLTQFLVNLTQEEYRDYFDIFYLPDEKLTKILMEI